MPDTGVGYFESMYSANPDPWGFDSRWYERRKFELTLAALSQQRYRRAFEPGCANGALTTLLAERCDELISCDFVESAITNAAARVRDLPNVTILNAHFPTFWPSGTGDLVVMSEVAYYLDDASAQVAVNGLERWLHPGGDIVSVHYIGETDYPRSGRSISTWLDDVRFLQRLTLLDDPQFQLGVWRRVIDDDDRRRKCDK